MSWPVVRLGDFVDRLTNGYVGPTRNIYEETGIPYILARQIKNNILKFDGKTYVSEDFNIKNKKSVLKAGDVLLVQSGHIGHSAVVPPKHEGHNCHALIVITPKEEVLGQYLSMYFSFLLLTGKIESIRSGSTVPHLTCKLVKELDLPLPSIYEQKRIVAILEEAFAGIDVAVFNTEKNLANARELFESCLQKIFSQHDEGWKVKPLESFSTIVNGFAFKSGDFSPQNEVKSIKITNVGVYEFVQESDNYLPQEYLEKYSQYKAYEGDVVVALTRTIISSGLKVAVVPADYDGALINQRVAAVHVNEEVMPKQVLQAFLSTKTAIDYVRSNVNELMQPNLSIKDLKAFPIPVPPTDKKSCVSSQIAEIKEQTDRLVSLYSSKLDSLNELKKSLLQKAFSGELTAEDDQLKEEAVA